MNSPETSDGVPCSPLRAGDVVKAGQSGAAEAALEEAKVLHERAKVVLARDRLS